MQSGSCSEWHVGAVQRSSQMQEQCHLSSTCSLQDSVAQNQVPPPVHPPWTGGGITTWTLAQTDKWRLGSHLRSCFGCGWFFALGFGPGGLGVLRASCRLHAWVPDLLMSQHTEAVGALPAWHHTHGVHCLGRLPPFGVRSGADCPHVSMDMTRCHQSL